MFFRCILLVVSLTNFLWDFHVSSCDENCTDKPVFTPSTLVVKYGDPTSARCSVRQPDCIGNVFKIESSLGKKERNGTMISWTVDMVTEWDASPDCYYTMASQDQCFTTLPVTVYQPPDNVSISFVNHTGPMFEGHQYTLQCIVKDVAPVKNLTVTFYRGQTELGQLQSNKIEKKPMTETFTLDINPSKEDDGVQYWCEAKLKLGPEGPQPPPVVTSQNIPATVYYKPQIESSHAETITITEGDALQLNCSAVGNPSPTYTWTLPSTHSSSSNSSVFTIDAVNAADEGPYTCSVSNSMGNVTARFEVVVQVLTSTRLPPTTTTTTATTTTPKTTTPKTTTPMATTPKATTPKITTPKTTTPKTTTTPNGATSILLHRFIMCFMLLFSTSSLS